MALSEADRAGEGRPPEPLGREMKSRCFAQFFGAESCHASPVFVGVQLLAQLTLLGLQVQQSALVIERLSEMEPDAVQPFAPDLQSGPTRSMLL